MRRRKNKRFTLREVLEQYVAENLDHLSRDELGLVASWKYRIAGDFYLMRFLKKYAVFMPTEKPYRLYG